MTTITTITPSSVSHNIDCNVLIFKNGGSSEANIEFASSGTLLSVRTGQYIQVFVSSETITDSLLITFANEYNNFNSLEIIETKLTNAFPNKVIDYLERLNWLNIPNNSVDYTYNVNNDVLTATYKESGTTIWKQVYTYDVNNNVVSINVI